MGSEAGHRPPLQPRNKKQKGEVPTPSSGQNSEKKPGTSYEKPLLLVYAGTSHRRRSFLQHAFPQTQYTEIEGGDEPDIPEVLTVMRGKISHVLPRLSYLTDVQQSEHSIAIVAADERTSVLARDEGGHTYLQSKGKPKSEDEIRQTFREMSDASQSDGIAPYYTIVAASGVHVRDTANTIHRSSKVETSVVELKPEVVAQLSTDEGFELYRSAFRDFYESELYYNNGTHATISMTDLASGLSLPVLVSMRAVSSIDGVPSNSPEFRKAFSQAFHRAAVGISPDVLRRIHRTPDSLVHGWEWAQQVATSAIRK